jgi:hypothetical protein
VAAIIARAADIHVASTPFSLDAPGERQTLPSMDTDDRRVRLCRDEPMDDDAGRLSSVFVLVGPLPRVFRPIPGNAS